MRPQVDRFGDNTDRRCAMRVHKAICMAQQAVQHRRVAHLRRPDGYPAEVTIVADHFLAHDLGPQWSPHRQRATGSFRNQILDLCRVMVANEVPVPHVHECAAPGIDPRSS